jgi:hypothetical protein
VQDIDSGGTTFFKVRSNGNLVTFDPRLNGIGMCVARTGNEMTVKDGLIVRVDWSLDGGRC